MLSFSRLDTLPRSAKMAILVVGDSLMAAVAVRFAVLLRAGGMPVLPGLYVAMVTVLVVLLVPTVAIVCGYHRLVLRCGTPTLVARSAFVSGLSGLILGGIGWYGGTTRMSALGLGAVFALVLFSEFVLSRTFARFLLTRNGSRGQGTVVAIYGAGAKLDQVTQISIEDLLGRDPVPPTPGLLEKCIRGKGVLITGGGGSIGSELCRQVLALQRRELVVLERSEIGLYLVEQELLTLAGAGRVLV